MNEEERPNHLGEFLALKRSREETKAECLSLSQEVSRLRTSLCPIKERLKEQHRATSTKTGEPLREHEPVDYGLESVCSIPDFPDEMKYISYDGADPLGHFFDQIFGVIEPWLQKNNGKFEVPEGEYPACNECSICGDSLSSLPGWKEDQPLQGDSESCC